MQQAASCPITCIRLSVLILLLAGLLAACTPEEHSPQPEEATQAEASDEAEKVAEIQDRDEWHEAMLDHPIPDTGCFRADHPKVEWQEVECGEAPEVPMVPAEDVGNSIDWIAAVTGNLFNATGNFNNVSGVTSVQGGNPPQTNYFTLQLNANPFDSPPKCKGAGCQGWQQFVYFSLGTDQGSVFMQYWLNFYEGTCPTGWNTWTPPNDPTQIHCWKNSPSHSVPPLTTVDDNTLENLALTGYALAGGNDGIHLYNDGTFYSVSAPDDVLGLAGNWTHAEFNIFGPGGGSQVVFNEGVSMDVRITMRHGSTGAPTCVRGGYTGETNNLNLQATSATPSYPYPTAMFKQSTSPGPSNPTCTTGAGTGP